jgi:uncharacterized repeat protein (TIGR01451 family)
LNIVISTAEHRCCGFFVSTIVFSGIILTSPLLADDPGAVVARIVRQQGSVVIHRNGTSTSESVLREGDKVSVGPKSSTRILIACNSSTVDLGENSLFTVSGRDGLSIGWASLSALQLMMTDQQQGMVLQTQISAEAQKQQKERFNVRSDIQTKIFEIQQDITVNKAKTSVNPSLQMDQWIRETHFANRMRQKIAYVNGGDLWMMNDDGTGKTNYIAAPAGSRIGRTAFSPNGSNLVYEVWSGGTGVWPTTSDLWIADLNGRNSRLLASAGSLADPTGKEGYTYAHRLLRGPCFSPDGSKVSCLRVTGYLSPIPGCTAYLLLGEQEVVTVPVNGGGVQSLYISMQRSSTWWYTNSPPSSSCFTGMRAANNTAWGQDERIIFPRTGHLGFIFDQWISSGTGTVYVTFANENGGAPASLAVRIGGTSADLIPMFKGYGLDSQGIGGGKHWYAYPPEWQNPMMGACYGPFVTYPVSAGMAIEVSANVGPVEYGASYTTVTSQSCPDYAPWPTKYSSMWSLPASGGAPSQFIAIPGAGIGSTAWSSDGQTLAVATWPNYFTIFDASGAPLANWVQIGSGEGYIGNWDAFNQRVVVGTGAPGTVSVVDVYSGDATSLGTGDFPGFMPLFRTELNVFEGVVSITDTNGLGEVLCGAGQNVVIDGLQNNGRPQPATGILAPYVKKITPPWGAAVTNTVPISVSFHFSMPVTPATLLSNRISGVSWGGCESIDETSFLMNSTLYATTLANSNSPNSFNDTVANVLARGIGTGQWSSNNTIWTFTITKPGFSQANGNWCEVDLALGGVQGTNGLALAFNEVSTQFQFVNPVNATGGTVRSFTGGVLTVPAGAVNGNTGIAIGYNKSLADTLNPPTDSGWILASGVFTFSPSAQPISGNVIVSLPMSPAYPGGTIWYYNGSSWSNVGGTFDAGSGTISVSVNHLGTFAAFYQPSASAQLRLTLSASSASAVTNSTVTYGLWLRNLGLAAATNVVVHDVLPARLSYVTNSASSGGSFDAGTRVLSWNLGTVAGTSNVWMQFDALVSNTALYASLITNTASVSTNSTVVTNSNPAVVAVGLPAAASACFGMGGTNSAAGPSLAALGATYRRGTADITTTQAQNTGLISFASFDTQVRSNQSMGLRTYGIVNCLSVSNTWPSATEFSRAFGLYVERYNGDGLNDMPGLTTPVHDWEIFSEFSENAAPWLGFTLEMYSQFLTLANATAHGIDMHVTVLSSSFVNVPPAGTTNYLQRLISQYPETLAAIDAVSVHERWEFRAYWTGSNNIPDYAEARSLREFLSGLGLGNRAVWISESDFRSTYDHLKTNSSYTCTQTDAAKFLARTYPFALANGISHLIYTEFEQKSGATEQLAWSAMIDTNANRRPSFYVFQNMIARLEGFISAQLIDFGGNNQGVKFITSSNQPQWVVWNVSNMTSQIVLPVGPAGLARITGAVPVSFNSTSATWSVSYVVISNGVATVGISGSPVYVEAEATVDPDIDGDGILNDQDLDMDGDGMPNSWETGQGINPFINDATDDADGDGSPNFHEYQAGTDPSRADSQLRCASLIAHAMPMAVTWESVPGKNYRVDWSTDLKQPWSNAVDGVLCTTGTVARWYDTGWPKTAAFTTNQPQRFYRIRVVP